MDDMTAFERQVGDEIFRVVGPARPVDDFAVFEAAATTSPKGGFRSLFGATKFVVAGATVALIGGLLISGVVTPPQVDEQLPAAATPSLSPSPSAPTDDAATDRRGTFSPTGSLAQGRGNHTATLLPDGRVLIVGGVGDGPGSTAASSAEIWDPVTGSFSPAGSLAKSRSHHTATLLPDGRVLIVGGGGKASAEIWDPTTVSFRAAGPPVGPRTYHTATLLPDGRVLILGGARQIGVSLAKTAQLWDPVTTSYVPVKELKGGRFGATATLLLDGRVLIVGGEGIREAEVWDPVSRSVEPADSLSEARHGLTATLLPDGRVLILGGEGANGAVATAEVWDPATASFTAVGSLAEARHGHRAALLPDGRILIVGGHGATGILASAEVWDSATASFSAAGSLPEPRAHHTATSLPDGRVLVVGRCCDDPEGNGVLASALIWEPGD